jgi:hypothetical protein
VYNVWQKRVYPKIPSIGESTSETVVETMIQSETCVSTFYNTFLTHNCVPFSHYLEFLGKLFFAIHYTYCGVVRFVKYCPDAAIYFLNRKVLWEFEGNSSMSSQLTLGVKIFWRYDPDILIMT